MVPRQILTVLVFALPILIVAFGVLMGASAMALAMQDAVGALALRWIAVGCLVLLVTDLVLLVGALGVNSLAKRDSSNDDSNPA